MSIFNPGQMVWDWIKKGVTHLLGEAKEALSGIVGKVLATFGLSAVTFTSVLPNLKAFVTSQVTGLPPNVMQVLGYLGVGEAISMILSALTIRMAWKVFITPKAVADQLSGGGA